jgi:hypothetical protein
MRTLRIHHFRSLMLPTQMLAVEFPGLRAAGNHSLRRGEGGSVPFASSFPIHLRRVLPKLQLLPLFRMRGGR